MRRLSTPADRAPTAIERRRRRREPQARRLLARLFARRATRPVLAALLLALLAACGTTPRVGSGNVSRLPPGNSQRDGPEANPPANLDAVPDPTPQIEPVRIGGPNKPYEIDGHTYVPLTDDRAVTEKGLASWYGKKFHGRRTASGEAYNMYAMTAAHKTLPIPSYARVRNPANGREIIVRVNDRGPFASGRVIDLSYTAALKLGVLGGVQPVEIERITQDDIRTGAAFRRGPTYAAATPPPAPVASSVVASASTLPPTRGDAGAPAADVAPANTSPGSAAAPRAAGTAVAGAAAGGVDPGSAAVVDAATRATTASSVVTPVSSVVTLVSGPASDMAPPAPSTAAALPVPAGVVLPPPSAAPETASATVASAPSAAPPTEERGRAETIAGAGFWVQIGAYRERNGALDFQHRLIDEQPWLAPLLAVFTDHGLNKLQAGPYVSRDDARSAAERIRVALQLVPTIVEKR